MYIIININNINNKYTTNSNDNVDYALNSFRYEVNLTTITYMYRL